EERGSGTAADADDRLLVRIEWTEGGPPAAARGGAGLRQEDVAVRGEVRSGRLVVEEPEEVPVPAGGRDRDPPARDLEQPRRAGAALPLQLDVAGAGRIRALRR